MSERVDLLIAFRRLLCSFADKLSDEECRNIVFIRLHSTRHKYRNATALDIFAKLETEGLFSSAKPEGLIEIAKDVNRQDLATEVEKFIKSQKKSASKEDKKANRRAAENQPQAAESDADLQLKANFEVTLAQATVLIQQVDILNREIAAGKEPWHRHKVEEAIKDVRQTVNKLAQTLERAQSGLEFGSSSDSGSDRSSADMSPVIEDPNKLLDPAENEELEDSTGDTGDSGYSGVEHWKRHMHNPPLPPPRHPISAGTMRETPPVSGPATPTPKPRTLRKPVQEMPAGLRRPVQETGRSAGTIATAKAHLPAMSGKPGALKPVRYGPPRETKPQSAPSTPSMDRVRTQPAVPPRKSSQLPASTRLTSSRSPVPVARQQYHTMPGHADSSNNHGYLDPVENKELEDSTGDTGDSGYSGVEHWKRHMHNPPLPPPRHPMSDSEQNHYYKSLNRSEIEVPSYDQVQHQDLLDRLTS